MKYNLEKMLHEVIRDLPETAKIERLFTAGYITAAEALEAIARAMKEEKARAAK